VTQSTRLSQEQWHNRLCEVSGFAIPYGTVNRWWFNPINHNSLRMTMDGYAFVNKYTPMLKWHFIELQDKMMPKQLLQMERLITAPYVIRQLASIYVLDETVAIMLQLHAGDLNTYLQNLEDHQ
jgi:hypothetical protein